MAKKRPAPAPTTAQMQNRIDPRDYFSASDVRKAKERLRQGAAASTIKPSSFEGGHRGPGQFWNRIRAENAAHAPKHPKPPPSIWGK